MEQDPSTMGNGEPEVLYLWSARKLHPIILLYVVGVFAVFMLVAFFIFHSKTGVKALAIAALGSIIPLVPGISKRTEYRLTARALEQRPIGTKNPRPFTTTFPLDQLRRIVPTRRGAKYYRRVDDTNPVRRLWKTHLSDAFSGEIHVEAADRERVFEILARFGASGD